MKRIPKAIYQTADQIQQRIDDLEVRALNLVADERQAAMKEIAQLRMYCDAKRWIESPGLRPVE